MSRRAIQALWLEEGQIIELMRGYLSVAVGKVMGASAAPGTPSVSGPSWYGSHLAVGKKP